MRNPMAFLISTGIGAAAMYYLDPARGRYRRGLVRDRIVHAGHLTKRGVRVVTHDMRNRAIGTAASVRSVLDRAQPDDHVLADRVRACLGRVIAHPASVHVEASQGVVTLSGPILEHEVPQLMDCVWSVRGVREVRNELEVHKEAGRVPGLQGNPDRQPGERRPFLQANWSPTARTLGGVAGAAATLYGLSRRTPPALALGAGGALLLARAATNLDMRRLLGVGAPRHAVEVHKSIRIHAPVEKVFALWNDFESFPRFAKHVLRARRLEPRQDLERWRWTVTGPLGTRLDFDAVITAREENRLLAWRTERGAFVQHAGRVHFQQNDDDTTTVEIKMAYNPVAGAAGHAVAWLLGCDPKHQMDDDLLRMKTYLETGRPPRDAAQPLPHETAAEREAWQEPQRRASGNGGARMEPAHEEQPAAH
ncbi:MAG TPA: SRPBCC family protein [Gammaproteobacteria bacterium]